MIGPHTDFFRIVDNFARWSHIPSVPVVMPTSPRTPRVTIAIPTYRRPDLLREAIDSALGQVGWEDYDVIVVDNDPTRGSATERLVTSYTDSRLGYYKNAANLGMAGNWNRCFELARADYVVLLHDDDLLFQSFLRECMAIVSRQPKIGFLKPATGPIDREERPRDAHGDGRRRVRVKWRYDVTNLVRNAVGAPTACLFDKARVLRLGGFNEDYYPTHDFCFMVLFARHYGTCTMDRMLSSYRILVNESMNPDTVKSFYRNDFFLLKQLAARYFLPWTLYRQYLGVRFHRSAVMHRQHFDGSFELDLATYGLERRGVLMSALLRCLVRIYVFMWEGIRRYVSRPAELA